MNIEKYDEAVQTLQNLSARMKDCRDVRLIREAVRMLQQSLTVVEAALGEDLLSAKEVPRFANEKCECGQAKIAGARFCVNCGKTFVVRGVQDSCG